MINDRWSIVADRDYTEVLSVMTSLLVMMVVLGVAFQQAMLYVNKSYFTNFYSVLRPTQLFISEFYSYYGRFPDNRDIEACDSCFISSVEAGHIVFQGIPYYNDGSYEFSMLIDNKPTIVMMSPSIVGRQGSLNWNCGYAEPLISSVDTGLTNTTSIDPLILPSICR